MRKALLSVLLFFVYFFAISQSSPQQVSAELDHALVAKDTVAIKKLLDPCLSFGHSNGWLQSMKDVVSDVASGKLNYTAIDNSDVKWETSTDRATMRGVSDIKYLLDGKEASIRLHVLQVWVKNGKSWQLMARQGVKLN
jgi:hypothetical protein